MFGLGIELDHIFGSTWLIDELFQLGISYQEVALYKQSVLQDESVSTLLPPPSPEFIQWAADNVDHNIKTLNGEGTFHGMGITAMSMNVHHCLKIDKCMMYQTKGSAQNRGIHP